MTIDVATLVFEFKSDSAAQAEKAMDRLIERGDRLDATAKKVRLATDRVNEAHRGAAGAAERAAQGAMALAQAEGAVERATRGVSSASAEVRAQRQLEARAMAELVSATKAYERDQARAAKAEMATAKAAADAQTAADRESERSSQQVLALRVRMAKQRADQEAATAREATAALEAADRAAERSAADVLAFRVRMARQRASEEAAEVSLAARAQMEADREAERSAQQVLALRMRLARQRAQMEAETARDGARAEALAAKEQADALATLERRVHAFKSALDPAYAAQARLDAEMKESTALYKMGAISASDYAARVGQLDEQMAAAARGQTILNGVMVRGAGSAKFMQRAGLDLSRQFADIGVTAAMGMNPLMILIQQGPQIADVFAQGRAQGLGFNQMLGMMGSQASGLLRLLAPVGVVVGALVAGFALFEREVDKSTKNATTWGDTWKATVHVVGDIIMKGPIGDALRWLGGAFGATLDAIVDGVMWWADQVVGFFGAAFNTIVKNWNNLPAAFGVILQGAANIVIRAVEGMVNKTIDAINYILKAAGKQAIGHIDLREIRLANAAMAADFEKTQQRIAKSFREGREGIADRIAKQADKEFAARQKAAKGAKDHADAMSDAERARLRAIEQTADFIAKLEDEVAQLKMNEVEQRRYAGSKEMALAIGRGDLGSAERIRSLMLEREALAQINRELAEAAESVKAIKAQGPIDFVNTPADIGSPTPTPASDRIRNIETELDRVLEKWDRIQGAADAFKWSIKNEDYVGAFRALISVLGDVVKAFENGATAADKMAAATALASAAGNIVGGRGGRALSGAASGAQAGFVLTGGNPIGAVIGGIIGGVAGFFGGGSKKAEERRRAAEEARNRALEIEAQRVELQIALLQTQGKATEALARQREAELAAMDASLHLLQQQLWAEQDAAKRRAFDVAILEASGRAVEAAAAARAEELRTLEDALKPLQQAVWRLQDLREETDKLNATIRARKGLEAELYDAIGRTSDALRVRRALELEQVEEGLRPLQQALWAVQDAAAATKAAEDALAAAREAKIGALEREADAQRETVERLEGVIDTLRDFRRELEFGAIAGRDPISQYLATQREFLRLSAMPANSAERMERLPGVGQAFLEASRAASPTQLAFDRDLQAVRRAVDASTGAAMTEADIARAELARLDALIAAEQGQVAAVLSTTDAVNNLKAAEEAYNAARSAEAAAQLAALAVLNETTAANQAAMAGLAAQIAAAQAQAAAAQTAATAANQNTPRAFDPDAYLAANPGVLAEYQRHTKNSDIAYLASLGIYNAQGYAAWHYNTMGKAQGFGFAGGGMHAGGLRLVGEEGPELEVTGPSRIYSARDTARMLGGGDELVAEVRALRAEVSELRRQQKDDNATIKRDVKETADTLARVTQGGTKIRTVAA